MKIWLSLDASTQFQSILPGFKQAPAQADFCFGKMPDEVKIHYDLFDHMWSVGVYGGRQIGLFDGFLLDTQGNPLASGEVGIHPGQIEKLPVDVRQSLKDRPRRVVPGRVAAIIPPGPGYHIYGHWLVDILPRIALLESAGHDIADLYYPLPRNAPNFGRELLGLCGVPSHRLVHYDAGEILLAEDLSIPSLVHNGVAFSPFFRNFVDFFRGRLRRAGYDLDGDAGMSRIFLARVGGNRRLLNREMVESLAQEAGFVLVRPETMSLRAQFALFASAREITGEYGSAFHTSLLSPRATVVCGLRGGTVHPGFIQAGIGYCLEQPTGWVFGEPGGAGPYDYSIPEAAFEACLRQVFGWTASRRRTGQTPATAPAGQAHPGPDHAGSLPVSSTEPARLRWKALEQTYVKASTTLAAHLPDNQKFLVREGDVIEADTAEPHDNHLALTAPRLNGGALPARLWYMYPFAWLRL